MTEPVSEAPLGNNPNLMKGPTQYYDFTEGALHRIDTGIDEEARQREIWAQDSMEDRLAPTPEWLKDEVIKARSFVAKLTGFDESVLPDVLVAKGLSTITGVETAGGYSPTSHTTYLDKREADAAASGNPHLVNMAIRTVTHETGHGALDREAVGATVLFQDLAVGSLKGKLGIVDRRVNQSINHGFNKSHIVKETVGRLKKREVAVANQYGSFFEEGFAEEIGLRYDEHRGVLADVVATDPDDVVVKAGLSRFTHLDKAGKETLISEAGYAAAGLEILEQTRMLQDPTGETLFDIMVATRHAETRVSAMRKFAQVIENIQPGLYSKLNHLQYKKEDDFLNGLLLIADVYWDRYDQIIKDRPPTLQPPFDSTTIPAAPPAVEM